MTDMKHVITAKHSTNCFMSTVVYAEIRCVFKYPLQSEITKKNEFFTLQSSRHFLKSCLQHDSILHFKCSTSD